MTLDIKRMLRPDAGPQSGEGELDFSRRDFAGFAVPGPVALAWQARPMVEYVRLDVEITCTIAAECARCLEAFEAPLRLRREMDIRPEELIGEYTEYPATPAGMLDLEELAYGEVVLEAPTLPLCREECPGLCPRCGRLKENCDCPPESKAEAPPQDPRWNKLRALLEDER